jgi:hypothetical protein
MRLLRLLRVTGPILGHPLASHLEWPIRCSSSVQQPQRTELTPLDPRWPADLRQQPSTTPLPLDGKEKVRLALSA